MKHYVVTGGAGFIGSNLIKKLFDENASLQVTCIDNFDPFYSPAIKRHNLKVFEKNNNFKLIELDLADVTGNELSELIPDKVDAIVHIAAKAGVRPSIENPLAYQRSNILGLQNLLDLARQKGIEQFVFASSSSVYGINDHFPWKESELLMPVSPYAGTKLAGEMMGHISSRLFGLRFLALRFFTVYGPAQRPDLAIHRFVKAIRNGEPITMFGDGSTSRDYTYVSDTVEGIYSAINYHQSQFELINLGNNYSVTLRELISAIEEVVGEEAKIMQMPEQPGDVPRTFADISKAKELLGYKPKVRLKDGLQKFYTWYLENEQLLQ